MTVLPGEDVAACVVPRAGASVECDALAAHCSGRLPARTTPRRWLVADALPRDPMGTVSMDELRTRLIDRSG